MLSRITLILTLLFLSNHVNGQKYIEAIERTQLLECEDIAYSSSVFFVELIENKQYDSAKKVLEYWEGKCGFREPVFRAKVILTIATRQNTDILFDKEIVYQLSNYQNRVEMIRSRDFSDYDYNKGYFGFVPIGQEYDSFTFDFFNSAGHLRNRYNTNDLLIDFYNSHSDTMMNVLQSEYYSGSSLSREYFKLVNKLQEPTRN